MSAPHKSGRLLIKSLLGAVVVITVLGAIWSGFRALATLVGLDSSSWWGGLLAFFPTLVVFGFAVNFLGLFIRARHPDSFAALIAAIRRVTSGDFGVTVDIHPDNPLGTVAGEINLMVQSLRSMEEMRQEFISTVSHEIQSPLTSIAGFAKALREPGLGEETRLHYLSIIEEESGRLSRLADGLLRLTALDSKGLVPEAKSFALDVQIRSVVIAAEPQWDAKKLVLDLELERVEAYGDEAMLAQVWTNLLHNAVKFSETCGHLAISLRRSGTLAIVRFTDEGQGIAPEDVGLVFDRFFKADRSRTRSDAASGSGLGLAIAKKIVELNGGSIRAESDGLGKGSEFIVELPTVVTAALIGQSSAREP
jgi:signal transduction histidine kinase